MPTYTFRCEECGRLADTYLSISEYLHRPPTLACCAKPMQRFISVAPAVALSNALASERHYDGLRATDGTDIGTRAKHREYMRSHNLTTVDDFAGTWAKQAEQREARIAGTDTSRTSDIVEAVNKLGG